MIDSLAEALVEFVVWLFFWPVALIVSAPVILGYAAVLAVLGRRPFLEVISAGFWSVTVFWKENVL